MTHAFFNHVLREAQTLTSRVCLHVLGEPCVHPQLDAFLASCHDHELEVELTTNGTLLQEKSTTALAPAVRQINISVHNVLDKEKIDWERLDTMLEFVRGAMRTRPDVYINLRLWNRSAHNAQSDFNAQIREYIASRLGITCPEIPAGRKSRCLTGRLYLHQDSRFFWPGQQAVPIREKGFCHALTTHCAILVDGTVCPCCLDAEGHMALGSLQYDTLSQILLSPRATAMREGFARGILIEKQCQCCDYCRRFPLHRQHAASTLQAKTPKPSSQ